MSNFVKLREDAVMPMRGSERSAGYDISAIEPCILKPGERALCMTGLSVSMEANEYLAIVPRSGLANKYGITVLNTPGTIDADYYPREIGVILYNSSDETFVVQKGDRIAQAILKEYKTMENDLVKSSERTGGFGSTGVTTNA